MPQTEHVAEFVETLGAFYELIEEGPVKGPAGDPGVANGSDEFSGMFLSFMLAALVFHLFFLGYSSISCSFCLFH